MRWPGATLTDSGGYQVFSLAPLIEVSEEGVSFRSHIDGSEHLLTPESAIEIQHAIGADIIMAFDQPVGYPADRASRRRTPPPAPTAGRSGASKLTAASPSRRSSASCKAVSSPICGRTASRRLRALPFDGYAIGGLSVGEPKAETFALAGRHRPAAAA